MRVLIISTSPVHKSIASGNTFLNVLENFDGVEIASVCTRVGDVDPRVSECFCITEKMLVKNLRKGTPVGRRFVPSETSLSQKEGNESSADRAARRRRWTVFFWAQNLLWRMGRWKNASLREFVEEFQPDIILTYLTSFGYFNRLVTHILSLTPAKLVLYVWDNNYTNKRWMFSPLKWLRRFMERPHMRRLAKRADQLYVICEGMKEEFEKSFRRECRVLTKAADFSPEPALKPAYGHPLQLVYTGNILLGRWKSLENIARVLERVNRDGVRAQLRIYTGNTLTKAMSRALNRGESSRVMGSVPASEVAGIQANADMLVHVEATDLKNRLAVRQSFSTKIVDYLAAARPILVYGSGDVASVRHFLDNHCAIIAHDPDGLYRELTAVLDDDGALNRLAEAAYACGRRHHEQKDIRRMLQKDFEQLLRPNDTP